MKNIRRALKEDWDGLLTDFLFIAFGVGSFIDQPKSFNRTPELFTHLLQVEFVVIGIILMSATILQNYRLKMAGFILYILALLTMAGLVSVVGSSTVSLLILAFAVRGYTSIREMQTRRQFLCDLKSALRSPPEDP